MAEPSIGPTKTCSKCGEEKPRDLVHFAVENKRKDRIGPECRHCNIARKRREKQNLLRRDPEHVRAKQKRQNSVDYSRHKEKRLARVRERRKELPDVFREYDRRKQERHAESIAAYRKRKWAEGDREAAYERIRQWKAANPDKARAIEERRNERLRSDPDLRARATARVRRWAQANPGATAAQRARRRARELGAEGSYTRQDVHAILRLQDRCCYYCEVRLTRFDVDHWIPLIRGGSNHPENIVVCCDSCNSSKGPKLPWEWKPEKFSEGQTPR